MNEEERAEWLARAMDDLLKKRPAPERPAGFEDEELDSLLRVARVRLESAQIAAHSGLQYEGAIWQKVIERLENAAANHAETAPDPFELARAQANDAESAGELAELSDIAGLRQRLAREAMSFAEAHRDSVWRTVESRINARAGRKGLLAFLRRGQRGADELAPALDGLAVGQTVWRAKESRIDELVELARKRRLMGQMAQAAAVHSEQSVWTRVSTALTGHRSVAQPAPRRSLFPRLAFAGAALALIVAALGPLPATGFADHPATRLLKAVSANIGITESGPPPASLPAPVVLQGTPAGLAEASARTGLALREPASLPSGFQLASTQLLPQGVIASDRPAFLSVFTSSNASILVFQEAPGGDNLAAQAGAVTTLQLADGTNASYASGGWLPDANGFIWADNGAQTLVFERGGVRTIVQRFGPSVDQAFLSTFADSIK